MTEIYWITRFATISEICYACVIVFAIIFLIIIPVIPVVIEEGFLLKEEVRKKVKKLVKILFVAWVIATLGYIFVPSKKDSLIIYGIGGTIDYIQSNEKAKQLPDKVVDALTEYLESNK